MHVVCCEDFETELEEGYIEFEAVLEKLRTIYVTIAKILKRLWRFWNFLLMRLDVPVKMFKTLKI